MALLQAREALMTCFRPILREHEITEQQWRVLRALHWANSGVRMSDLARMTLLSMPSLSRLIRTLEAKKTIHRTAHRGDLRAAQLRITPAGRALVRSIAPFSEAQYAEITRVIGADDVELLYRLLYAVSSRLGTDGNNVNAADR